MTDLKAKADEYFKDLKFNNAIEFYQKAFNFIH